MKKLGFILPTMSLMFLSFTAGAMALPLVPSIPNDQPLFFQFTNQEQICAQGNCIESPDGNAEQNWGILHITSVFTGKNPPPEDQLFDEVSQVWSLLEIGGVPVFPEK